MKLTVNDRVLLFLYEHRSIQEDYEVSSALTQAGISEGIGISVTHVPRAVGKLEDEGFVQTKTSYVKGSSRKKKTYHLTRDGLMNAREFLTGLEAKKIKFSGSGSQEEIVLSDLVEKLKKEESLAHPPTSFEIIQAMNEDGSVELEVLKTELCNTDDVFPAKENLDLIGRDALLDRIATEISSNQIVLIQGELGIGKSSLIKAVIQKIKAEHHPHLIVNHLTEKDLEQVKRCLGSKTSDNGPLIAMDLNLYSGSDLDPVANTVLEAVSKNETRLILTAVEPVSGLKRLLEGKTIKVIEVGPLSEQDMVSLAKKNSTALPQKQIDSLIFMAKGNPGKLLSALEIEVSDDSEDLDDHEKALMRMLRSEEN